MARPLLGSYHHHHHLHGGTITISTEVIVMIPLEPPETPHRAKFQPLSALFQLCASLLFNPWWWYHPKEQTRFLFCNRYDCIPKHWLIVYCKCFILKWWHFPIVCKYLWIWGISWCLCWGLHEFVTKQSELPVRSSRCPSTALLLSQIRLLSNITDTSLKFHGVPSNIVQYNPTLPNTIPCNKHFTRIPLNTGRHYSVKGRSSCSQQINSTVQSFNLPTNDYNIMQLT